MKTKIIRLTENDVHNIIRKSVFRILNERHVLEIPKPQGDEMPPMDMPPMVDSSMPTMDDPNQAPMQDNMGEDGNMPPMDDANNMAGNDPQMDEITNMLGQLSPDDMKAARGYIESLLKDNDTNNDGINDSNQMLPPQDESMSQLDMNGGQMQESFMKEINNGIMGDRQGKRELKQVNPKVSMKNPFVSSRN